MDVRQQQVLGTLVQTGLQCHVGEVGAGREGDGLQAEPGLAGPNFQGGVVVAACHAVFPKLTENRNQQKHYNNQHKNNISQQFPGVH